jgi:electron transport complex protein RnfA
MTDVLLMAVAAATVNNFVLVRLLGLQPVLETGPGPQDIARITITTTLALTIAAGLCHLVEQWILAPYGLPYLRIVAFASLTFATVHGANAILGRPAAELPVIALNCMVLGVVLLGAGAADSVAGALAQGFGAGAGYGLVLLLFAGLRPRLARAPVARPLRGPAISLVTLGLMSLAFLGFSGLGT